MRYKWVMMYYCGVPDTWTQSSTASWKTCKGSQTSTQTMLKQWLFRSAGRLVLSQQATQHCEKECWSSTKAGGMVLTKVTNQASFLHQRLLWAVVFRAILRKCTWLTELNTYLPHPFLAEEGRNICFWSTAGTNFLSLIQTLKVGGCSGFISHLVTSKASLILVLVLYLYAG